MSSSIGDDESIRCETFLKFSMHKKYDEAVEHVLSGCIQCITNPRKKFDGREMLFPDAPPSWIKKSENEKSNPKSWEKHKEKNKSGNLIMSQEDIDKYLEESEYGDEKLVYEIVRYKKVDRQEAWKIMRQIRKKQAEKKKQNDLKEEKKKELATMKKADEKRKEEEAKNDEKIIKEMSDNEEEEENSEKDSEEESSSPQKKKDTIFNLKNEMPWSPNRIDILCQNSRSILDHEQQRRISAMCQNLMFRGDFQHNANKREFKDLTKSAEKEYGEIAEAAQNWARQQPIFPLDFGDEIAFRNILNSSNQKLNSKINYMMSNILFKLETNQETEISMNSESKCLKPILIEIAKKGQSDMIEIPNMRKKCEISKKCLRSSVKTKLPIIQDPTAKAVLLSTNCSSIMMDATTACHLLIPQWESNSHGIAIPISIKQENQNGKDKKIVILSKPAFSASITRATLQRKAVKRGLKRQFVKIHPKNENFEWKKALEEAEKEASEEMNIEDQPSTSTSSSDPLGSIFADIKKMDEHFEQKLKKGEENLKKIDTGYQYAFFRVGDVELLIRSRPPYEIEPNEQYAEKSGVHQIIDKQSISFEPRIEYLPNAGAMELGREEWLWNYLKKIFKVSNSHILFRTHYRMDNILQVDGLTMNENNLSARPIGALSLLSSRTIIFESFLKKLQNLNEGEYLAYQEVNQPLRIVPKCDENIGVSSKSLFIKRENVEASIDNQNLNYFTGLSPDVLLQWQIVQGRAPRMFLAEDSPIVKNLATKGELNMIRNRQKSIKRKFSKKHEDQMAKRKQPIDLDDPRYSIDFTNPSMLNAPLDSPPTHGRGQGKWRGRGRGRGRGKGRGFKSRTDSKLGA